MGFLCGDAIRTTWYPNKFGNFSSIILSGLILEIIKLSGKEKSIFISTHFKPQSVKNSIKSGIDQ